MPFRERQAYSQNFDVVQLIQNYNRQEVLILGDVGSPHGSDVLGDIERDRLISDINKARTLNKVIQAASGQLLTTSSQFYHHPLSKDELAAIDQAKRACPQPGPAGP